MKECIFLFWIHTDLLPLAEKPHLPRCVKFETFFLTGSRSALTNLQIKIILDANQEFKVLQITFSQYKRVETAVPNKING